jgi:hypothetical protein
MRPFLTRVIRRMTVVVLTTGGVSGHILAGEPSLFGAADTVQLKAKAALEKDPALKRLNLWVSVRDGVVLVNGGVSDEATAGKIEAVLSKVPGVSVVRVTTWVTPATDPIKKLVADKLGDAGTVTTTGGRSEPSLAVNPVFPAAVPTIPSLPDGVGAVPIPVGRSAGTFVAQRVEPVPGGGMLQLPVIASNGSPRLPVGIDVPPAPYGPLGYPTIRATRVPVAPADISPVEMALALLELRRSNPKFTGLMAEVRRGSAVVNGSAASKTDVDAFAAAVAKIAGIDRVSVGSIQIRSGLPDQDKRSAGR